MFICSKCNTQVPESAKFCPKCGSPIGVNITCPKCAKTGIPFDAKFCPHCGYSFKQEPPRKEEQLKECGEKEFIDGHEVVDLGLSVKWSLFNIGASDIKQIGTTFAWGDPTRKTITSFWSRGWFMRPTRESICGNPKSDMATYNWGSIWRLPKAEECQELLERCEWFRVNYRGQTMVKIVGPNENYMLVPANFKIWIGNHSNSSCVCYFAINLDINRWGIESLFYNVETHMSVRPVTR